MKLVTFNIRCDYGQDGTNNFDFRKQLIIDKIMQESPDIICFQEVLPHVALWLKVKLQDYYVIGCGRDEKLEDEQTSIAFKKTEFDLIGMDVFWLSKTPRIPASRYEDQSICPRICTEALLLHLETKNVLRIYNTHLDHIGEESRKLSLLQILDWMEFKNKIIAAPAILVGDFNALPNSPEMKVFHNYPQLQDLTVDVLGTFHDYGQLKEAEKIDYIFADKQFRCSRVSLWENSKDGVFLSDHFPICVEIYTK